MRILANILVALFVTASACPASAKIEKFPAGFRIERIMIDGASMYVRVGGKGPAIVMLHGFGDTGDMWAPMAAALVKGHTIIVPDLRGMGLSTHPEGGYDKKSQGAGIAKIMDALKVDKADRITKWAIIDAPIPGIGPWDDILKSPLLWHFNFRGPDVDRLVKGRERIYLDRFYNELSANPKAIDEATRNHYAKLYARPGNMHYAFEQFATFNTKDAVDNKAFQAKGKLPMPILALGADHSFGETQALVMREVGSNVEGSIIANSGHWIMEEQPALTVKLVSAFIDKK